MSELDYFRSVLLGVVQGLTEFLPVSSSGHLAIVQRQLGLVPDSPALLLFDIFAHVGTLIAVGYVFAPQWRRFIRWLQGERTPSRTPTRFAWRVAFLAVVATLPTAAIGLTFKDTFERAFDRPSWIAGGLIITGAVLCGTRMIGRGRRGWKQFRWWQAALVGIAQGLAILPGISRSGSTICVAAYCGLRRRWAGEFSFLIALPAIVGGAVLKCRETFRLPAEELKNIPWPQVLLGGGVSLVVGVFALRLLLNTIRRSKLHWFAVYCWFLGASVLAGSP